jgi:hypothetical protein
MNNWSYRPSTLYPNQGTYFKHVQELCSRHGTTEHTQIQDSHSVCRVCCQERNKKPQKTYASVTGVYYG